MTFLQNKMDGLKKIGKKIKDAFLSFSIILLLWKKVKFKSKSEGFEITISNDLVLRMEEETGRKACAGVQLLRSFFGGWEEKRAPKAPHFTNKAFCLILREAIMMKDTVSGWYSRCMHYWSSSPEIPQTCVWFLRTISSWKKRGKTVWPG